jgi:hypothetical protein
LFNLFVRQILAIAKVRTPLVKSLLLTKTKAIIKGSRNIFAIVDYTRNQAKIIKNRETKAKLIELLSIDSVGGMVSSKSTIFPFVSNDLVNGKLKKTHGWATTAIDVTVVDNLGREIEFSSTVSSMDVEVDFSRATITGTWQLLLERVFP